MLLRHVVVATDESAAGRSAVRAGLDLASGHALALPSWCPPGAVRAAIGLQSVAASSGRPGPPPPGAAPALGGGGADAGLSDTGRARHRVRRARPSRSAASRSSAAPTSWYSAESTGQPWRASWWVTGGRGDPTESRPLPVRGAGASPMTGCWLRSTARTEVCASMPRPETSPSRRADAHRRHGRAQRSARGRGADTPRCH